MRSSCLAARLTAWSTRCARCTAPTTCRVSAYALERRHVPTGRRVAARPGLVQCVLSRPGRSAIGSGSRAIHEEDALEVPSNKFQEDGVRRAPVLFLGELRARRDLLLLGCNLPGLAPDCGFLRSGQRGVPPRRRRTKKMEFFAADAQKGRAAQRVPLAVQSQRQASSVGRRLWIIGELEAMVATSTRTRRLPPAPAQRVTRQRRARPGPDPSSSVTPAKTPDAARVQSQSLAAIGFSDVWLDKRKLIAGDDRSDRYR